MIFLHIFLTLLFIFFNLIVPIFLYNYLRNDKIRYEYEKLKEHRIFSSISLFIFGIVTSLIAYFISNYYYIADIPLIFFILLFLFKIDTFTELFEKIIVSISFSLMIFNNIGGIIAGIWLLILGEWKFVIFGLIAAFSGSFILGFALMIPIIFAIPSMFFIERNNKIIGYIFGFFSMLTTNAIIFFWCIISFWIYYSISNPENIIPVLIWSYGVAVFPLQYLADKEKDNEFIMITTLFVQIAYIVMLILLLLFDTTLLTDFIVFGSFLIAAMLMQGILVIYEERRPKWMREVI
jgi:hypothetical protein